MKSLGVSRDSASFIPLFILFIRPPLLGPTLPLSLTLESISTSSFCYTSGCRLSSFYRQFSLSFFFTSIPFSPLHFSINIDTLVPVSHYFPFSTRVHSHGRKNPLPRILCLFIFIFKRDFVLFYLFHFHLYLSIITQEGGSFNASFWFHYKFILKLISQLLFSYWFTVIASYKYMQFLFLVLWFLSIHAIYIILY